MSIMSSRPEQLFHVVDVHHVLKARTACHQVLDLQPDLHQDLNSLACLQAWGTLAGVGHTTHVAGVEHMMRWRKDSKKGACCMCMGADAACAWVHVHGCRCLVHVHGCCMLHVHGCMGMLHVHGSRWHTQTDRPLRPVISQIADTRHASVISFLSTCLADPSTCLVTAS